MARGAVGALWAVGGGAASCTIIRRWEACPYCLHRGRLGRGKGGEADLEVP